MGPNGPLATERTCSILLNESCVLRDRMRVDALSVMAYRRHDRHGPLLAREAGGAVGFRIAACPLLCADRKVAKYCCITGMYTVQT